MTELLLESQMDPKGETRQDILAQIEEFKHHIDSDMDHEISDEELFKQMDDDIDNRWHLFADVEKKGLEIALYNRGLLLLKKKKSVKAGRYFQRLLEMDSQCYYLDMIVGLIAYQKNDLKKGIDILHKFYLKGFQNCYNNINLGILYSRVGNTLLSHKHFLLGTNMMGMLGGHYKRSELIRCGNELHEQEKYKDAIKFFLIICKEAATLDSLTKLSEQFFKLDRWQEALGFYIDQKAKYPKPLELNEILLQIHDHFSQEAASCRANNKLADAAENYDKALLAFRHPNSLDKASKVFRALKQNDKSFELETEYRMALEEQRETERENEIQLLIESGKNAVKKKDYTMAISQLEKAFKIRNDKGVFMYLSYIYKTLNYKKALNNLIYKYKKEIERQEKIPK